MKKTKRLQYRSISFMPKEKWAACYKSRFDSCVPVEVHS